MGQFPPWKDLPEELLSAIAGCCLNSNPIDLLRFRSVCKPWYSSSLSLPTPSFLSPLLPQRLPCPPSRFRDPHSKFSVLSTTIVYALSPREANLIDGSLSTTKIWLMFVDQLNPGKFSIRQPLTTWHFSMPFDFPREFNLVEYHAPEIGRFYNVSIHAYANPFGEHVKPGAWSGESLKVVFVSDGSIVIALTIDGKLGILRLGGERTLMDAEWEILHDGKGYRFHDIVEYKGRILGVDRKGKVYEMGIDNFSGINVIVRALIKGGGKRRKRLIESSGILHLVVRRDVPGEGEEIDNIKVYKLNEKTMRWNEVKSIGDQIFFFGISFSFSASAKEFEGFCGKNCIMYEQHSFRMYDAKSGGSWLFVKPESTSLKVGVYHLEDGARIHPIESYPCYSDILWPPPTWIWPDNRSRLLGTLEHAIDRLLMEIQDETLKAKYKELSSRVKSIVLVEDINQHDMLKVRKESKILENFMNDIESKIDKEFNNFARSIADDFFSRRAKQNSTQLPNQIGSADHRAAERHGCANCLQKAIEYSTGDGSLVATKLVIRRLEAHKKLMKIFVGATEFVGQRNTMFRDYSVYRKYALGIASSSQEKLLSPYMPSTSRRKSVSLDLW